VPRNVYSEINLHLTWHTKHDVPVLVDVVENRTHHYLRHRALQTHERLEWTDRPEAGPGVSGRPTADRRDDEDAEVR